jgi:hypothetical protein
MIRLPLKEEQNSAKIGESVMAALDAEAPGASCAASSSSARRSARNSPKTARWRCCW